MKTEKISVQKICMIAFAICINFVGGQIALFLKLPIYLDSIGTVFVVRCPGTLLWNALPNLLSGLLMGMTVDIYSLYYAPVGILLGFVTGLVYRKFQPKKWQIFPAALVITLPSTIISSCITAFLFGGITSSGSTVLVQLLAKTPLGMVGSCFVVQFITDYIDRVLCIAVATVLITAPRKKYEGEFCLMKVLITGTASGIGKGCAELFLKENHEVYGFDKNISSIQHPKYTHFCLDIRDKSSYPEIGQVDILINNAGVQNGDDIDVNLKGTISVTEHYGIHPNIYSVIMIGSASGHTGSEFPEYAASKGGVLAYTKNVAMRIAPYQATCNSLDFGGVMTELNRPVMEDEKLWDQIMELTPLKRWMSVEEAAEWIYFMAVKNRFCTGQNILIDGLEAGNCNFIWP
ncbi:SDR family oxidoreductase [Blautia wexlerae]|nr:SDR family oxidoreductase [Blautia wexlerae]